MVYTVSLKAARVNAELSQEEAAEQIGVRQETISSWENKKTYPKSNQLDKIAEVYHIPKDMLKT